MRTIAVIAALTAVAVLLGGGPNDAPAALSSVELAFDRGGWIYAARADGTGALEGRAQRSRRTGLGSVARPGGPTERTRYGSASDS